MHAFVIGNVLEEGGETRTFGDLKRDVPVPEPAKGEALIRVLRAGVCNTDLELLAGYIHNELVVELIVCRSA